MSDKPAAIAGRPPLTHPDVHAMRKRFRCTLAAMHEVDLGIGRVRHELKTDQELGRTIVVYLSDNGFFFGEHRLTRGKSLPYEPALRVPYAVRVPRAYRGGPRVARVEKVASNQDVAPTLLDYAGGAPSCASHRHCRTLDGRSLRPLLGGPGSWPHGRGVLAEINSAGAEYSAIRVRNYVYVEYTDGERELYNLKADPGELHNVAGTPRYASLQASLALRLAALRHCSGIHGPSACG